jgi:diaminopimelate decarboxylase
VFNLDDITHIEYIDKRIGLPDTISFRYNPGPLRGGNDIIGKPEEAKYGLTREQLFDAYRMAKEKGVKNFGIHTMIVSNELNREYLAETARMMFELIDEISREVGIRFSFVNFGGGIGVPYRPEQEPVDLEALGEDIRVLYEEMIVAKGYAPLKICLECGRMVTGPYGYLVTKAIHRKDTYKHYIGVDASMADLMRPGMYGAYHHCTVLGKEDAPATNLYDIVGSLCENCDKFAVDRMLPKIDRGDILVIHDTGAHGYAMGYNYNGKLKSAELLLQEDGSVKMIRRAETPKDYFATFDCFEIGEKLS